MFFYQFLQLNNEEEATQNIFFYSYEDQIRTVGSYLKRTLILIL